MWVVQATLRKWLIAHVQARQNLSDFAFASLNVQEGQLRLADGSDGSVGRPEVNVHDEWRPVCAERLDVNIANVLCNSLSFDGALSLHVTEATPGSGVRLTEYMHAWISELQCTGHERDVFECQDGFFRKLAWHPEDCNNSLYSSLECRSKFCSGRTAEHCFLTDSVGGGGGHAKWGNDGRGE